MPTIQQLVRKGRVALVDKSKVLVREFSVQVLVDLQYPLKTLQMPLNWYAPA